MARDATLTISLLSKAYVEKPSSVLHLLSSSQTQWKRVFVTSIFTELIAFNCSSLLLVLGYPLHHANRFRGTNLLKFTMAMTGFGLFVFVHLACQLSLVVSSVEESSHGLFAIRRAAEIIRGRRLQSFVLTALMLLLDALVSAPVGIVFLLLWCSVYSVLYLDSREGLGTEEDEERWLV